MARGTHSTKWEELCHYFVFTSFFFTPEITSTLGPKLQTYISEAYANGRIVRAPFADNRVLIFEKVGSGADITIFLVSLRMNEIADNFKMSTAQKMYLTTSNGTILFGPENSSGQLLRNFFDISFLEQNCN